jgi:DNA-binding response OmpR family regulator
VLVDRSEVERSLLNLAINARDAMVDGGRFAVRSRHRGGPDAHGSERIEIEAADNGVGMDADTAAHCFEPFFTTKGRARGTGLGLATVHATVVQAGGEVTLRTAPGEGTTFTLWFPAVTAGTVAPATPAVVADTGFADGGARPGEVLLVVDDEEEVLRLSVRELRSQGYEVLGAPDAASALAVLVGRGGGVDLLVTDVVLPETSGIELVERARHRYPQLRVLFVSGHLDDEYATSRHLPPGADLLAKPFTPGALSARVRQALEAPKPPPPGAAVARSRREALSMPPPAVDGADARVHRGAPSQSMPPPAESPPVERRHGSKR